MNAIATNRRPPVAEGFSARARTLDGRWVLGSPAAGRVLIEGKAREHHRFQFALDVGPGRHAAATVGHLLRLARRSASGTVVLAGRAIGGYWAFLGETGCAFESAESFSAYATDLERQGLGEAARRSQTSAVLNLTASWVAAGLVADHALAAARRRFAKAFRGFKERERARALEHAIGPEEYVRLLRALRMELEEARALLERPAGTWLEPRAVTPLLPFVLLSAGVLGVRPVEVNAARAGDVRAGVDGTPTWHVHAPNKDPGAIPLLHEVRAAWEVAARWMGSFRPDPPPHAPLLAVPRRRGRGSGVTYFTATIGKELPRFYAKYFARTDADGVPVLYRERGGARVPFDLTFPEYRIAAITAAARHEANPERLRIFARHRSLETTMRYYVREAHVTWVKNIALAQRADAERLRMAMTSRVEGSAAIREAAVRAGALVPGGHCARALAGDRSCRRSVDCRLCTFFRIDPERREVFVAERDRALGQAEAASCAGLKRDAERLRTFAALNQAVIDRIDDYYDALLDGEGA